MHGMCVAIIYCCIIRVLVSGFLLTGDYAFLSDWGAC